MIATYVLEAKPQSGKNFSGLVPWCLLELFYCLAGDFVKGFCFRVNLSQFSGVSRRLNLWVGPCMNISKCGQLTNKGQILHLNQDASYEIVIFKTCQALIHDYQQGLFFPSPTDIQSSHFIDHHWLYDANTESGSGFLDSKAKAEKYF